MTPEDLQNIDGEYSRVHAVTPHVLTAQYTPQTLRSIDEHQRDLNEVIGALEGLEAHYEGIIKRTQALLGEVHAKKKNLDRDFDDCKRRYWTVKKEMDRSPSVQ